MTQTTTAPTTPRFQKLTDLAETLNIISAAQAYALVRSGELPAIKVGGRGQWRVESDEVDRYIARSYTDTRAFIDAHPFGSAKGEDAGGEGGALVDQVDPESRVS